MSPARQTQPGQKSGDHQRQPGQESGGQESRGQSNIPAIKPDSDCHACNVTLTLSVKWLLAALIMVSELGLSADEQQFGRLFTTPEQRQRLGALREQHIQAQGSGDRTKTGTPRTSAGRHHGTPQAGAARGPGGPPVITLKGLVYRNDGARTAWFEAPDGAAVTDYRRPEASEMPDPEAAISVPVPGQSVKLKPGQSYHPESGAVIDLENNDP